MIDLDSLIFKRFSNNCWVVVPSKDVTTPKDFNFLAQKLWLNTSFTALLDEDNNWEKQRFMLSVSPDINGYKIIESELFNYPVKAQILQQLSASTALYFFQIDLWHPSMQFTCYNNGVISRSYQIYPTNNTDTIEFNPKIFGALTATEKSLLNAFDIHSPEYEHFWFPLRFMKQELGISAAQIDLAFKKEANLFEASTTIKTLINTP